MSNIKGKLFAGLVASQTAILLGLALIWAVNWTQEFRNGRETAAANLAFAAEYPAATLAVTGKIASAWFFNYSQDGQNFQVVRLGDNWLNVGQ